ncbi:MAG: HDOD domain-containing protein [Deltaproteobacteria bacterium]|nr:HDOD domain-containing protein [Deltaproteobacteria bacterium]
MQPQAANRTDVPRILDEIREQRDLGANPQAIERLNQALGKEHCNTLGLAHAILQDPGLSAKILRVVNSVAFGARGEPVSTISRAIVLIGFERVREIATGLLLIQQLTSGQPGSEAVHDNLRRALRCALTAQAVATRAGGVPPEQAYLLGLFANVGLLWLAAFYPDVFARALALEGQGAQTLEAAVTATAGVSSDRIAMEVLRHWSLPETYVHHFRRRSGNVHALHGTLAERLSAVVEVAELYTCAGELGVPVDSARVTRLEAELELSPKRLADALESVAEQLPGHIRALGIAPARPRKAAALAPGGGGAKAPPAKASPPDVVVQAQPPGPVPPLWSADASLAVDVAVEVTGSILDDEDVNHNLIAVVEGVARAGGFDVVVLGLVSKARDVVVPHFCYGTDLEREGGRLAAPLRRGAGLLAEAILDATPRVVERGTTMMLVPAGAPVPRIAASSFVVQPLVMRGKAIGVIVAMRTGAPSVTRAVLPFVQMLSNLACLALRELAR